MDSWTPVLGQKLLVRREPTNHKDKNAVAVYEDNSIVGHVPFNMAPYLSRFLARENNNGFAEVTAEKVYRGAGYGLEIPFVYRLYGPKIYRQDERISEVSKDCWTCLSFMHILLTVLVV